MIAGLKPHQVDGLVGTRAKDVLDAAQYWMPDCPWPDAMVQSQFAPVIDGVELTAPCARRLGQRGGR